jgi:hypothetical protein
MDVRAVGNASISSAQLPVAGTFDVQETEFFEQEGNSQRRTFVVEEFAESHLGGLLFGSHDGPG